MTGPAPRIDAEAIRHGVSLLDLLPTDARPRRTGKDEYRALCSFHEEKVPAMGIKLLRSGWYFNCFACGERGDSISYYMRTRKVSFKDALQALAEGRTGLDVTTPTKRRAPAWLLVCDSRGCTSSLEVEEEDRPYLGETFALAWWVGRHRAYCSTCVRQRLVEDHSQRPAGPRSTGTNAYGGGDPPK